MQHCGTRNLRTERLLLRRYTPNDATSIYRNYATDERVTKFLSWRPYDSISQLETFISEQIASYRDDVYNWVIDQGGEVIGSISVVRLDERNASCEIGYCLGFHHWNQGIATEAMRAVISYLFVEAGFHRIFAKHDAENPASGKVMTKCGMTLEGRLRAHYQRHDGTRADALQYSILRTEFQ